jgi:hypothetical protein
VNWSLIAWIACNGRMRRVLVVYVIGFRFPSPVLIPWATKEYRSVDVLHAVMINSFIFG